MSSEFFERWWMLVLTAITVGVYVFLRYHLEQSAVLAVGSAVFAVLVASGYVFLRSKPAWDDDVFRTAVWGTVNVVCIGVFCAVWFGRPPAYVVTGGGLLLLAGIIRSLFFINEAAAREQYQFFPGRIFSKSAGPIFVQVLALSVAAFLDFYEMPLLAAAAVFLASALLAFLNIWPGKLRSV